MIGFPEVLNAIGSSVPLHARLLNTLSMLEYIGVRKILKSQLEHAVSEETLAHAAEEIRHAQILKRVALKLSDGKLASYHDDHLLAGIQARSYFQAIDRGIERELGHARPLQIYQAVTLLIEERAREVYVPYEAVLAAMGLPGRAAAILRDEERHLEDVTRSLKEEPGCDDLELREWRRREARLFSDLCQAWVVVAASA